MFTAKQRSRLGDYIRAHSDWDAERFKLLGQSTEEEAESQLEELIEVEGWPDEMDLDDWQDYYCEFVKVNPIPFVEQGAMLSDGRGDAIAPLAAPNSSWKALRSYFETENHLSPHSIESIEASSNSILYELSQNTMEKSPIKGLVYGSVQSGKTANMEALISNAADREWNIFVILTGTIESLRVQTRDRFKRDLRNTQSIRWRHLDLGGEDKGVKIDDLNLGPLGAGRSADRYVLTCLKQKSRLTKLLNWLHSQPMMSTRVRLIVIDDEADQAGVNTSTLLDWEDRDSYEQDRTIINQLLVNLSEGRRADGTLPKAPLGAINYISYTATPYANVLNEAAEESLYPRDFIRSLEDPEEYFGLNAIFGNSDLVSDEGESLCPGLDVIRKVSAAEQKAINDSHKTDGPVVCESMEEAIAWFVCSVAALRLQGYRKPLSMLIHTSSKTDHHKMDYDDVGLFLRRTDKSKLIDFCRSVYEAETRRFGYNEFKAGFNRYGRLEDMPKELPSFDEIAAEVREVLSDVANIQEGKEGLVYSKGINLCLDNSRADREFSEGSHIRIAYPDKDTLASMEKAPAFIVFGGNTLARGLTLEGLICTYFTRTVKQADTLLQMGRWFGFRRDCELYQRIWLTADAHAKYMALAKVEMNLKSEIKRFEECGLKPKEIGVKVSSMPELAQFELTNKKKMQDAVACSYDFTGYGHETTAFEDDTALLKENIRLAEDFLNGIETRGVSPRHNGSTAIWEGVSSSDVVDFIRKFRMYEGSEGQRRSFDSLCAWIEAATDVIDCWNIAVPGKKNSPSGEWCTAKGTRLCRVERTRKIGRSYIDIGSLRENAHVLCDVREEDLSRDQLSIFQGDRKKDAIAKRAQLGFERTPLLLIYRLDCKSHLSKVGRERIGTDVDVVGVSAIIPGDKHAGGSKTAFWIDMGRAEGENR